MTAFPASHRSLLIWGLLFASAFCLMPALAHAASTGGSGLEWETPLQKIRDSVTGPVAYAISLLGIVVTGAILVFGGEINEFVRRLIMLVLVISLMVFAADLLNTLFNKGAVIG
jgi:type IV secretion system protein VirB2